MCESNYDENTKTLTTPYYFEEEIKDIPKGTENIIFTIEINKNYLCNSIFLLDINLPETLKYLTLSPNFNQTVNNLAKNLLHLTFGYRFNQSVDNLPETLTHLTFGRDFNQSVEKLPKNLLYLTFGSYFNQTINNLPETLTH